MKRAENPRPGIIHDYSCTHDPCRCRTYCQLESDRRLFLVTLATMVGYVAAVAVGSLGVVLAVTGRPAGLTLIAVAVVVAAVAWGLRRTEAGS